MFGHRVRETTSTQGIGPIELNGAVGTGFRHFRDEFANGQQCAYVISNVGADGNGDYEIGIGTLTYGTTDTLSRDTVVRSSAGGAKVNWGPGVKTVFSDLLPDWLVEQSRIPPGTIMVDAGEVAPPGWLLCYGQVVSRTTYAALFARIGTKYNTGGEASDSFRLPDAQGRVVAGKDDMGGSAAGRLTSAVSGVDGTTLGATGGDQRQQSHAHAQQGTFGTTNAGPHTHNNFSLGGSGSFRNYIEIFQAANTIGPEVATSLAPAGDHDHDVTISGNTGPAGAGNSQNVQPTIVLNFIIKY